MNDYSFSEFLKSIEDLDFFHMDEKARYRKQELERLLNKGKKSPNYYEVANLFRQIKGVRYWFAASEKAAGLTDEEFLLLEPICRKLIEKGLFKATALDVFARLRQKKSE
jgi:hypothetical protein